MYKFYNHFSLKTEFKVNGRRVTKWHGLKNKPMLDKLLKGKYIRRLTEEAIDLPEIVRKDVVFKLNHEQKDLAKAYSAHVSMGKDKHISTRKKDSASLKAQCTTEYVERLIEMDSGAIVIFTDHLESAHFLMSSLMKSKYKGRLINGATTIENRQAHVNEFQSGALDYIVLTIGAGSTGITLTKAKHMVFNDLSWVPARNAQAEKRIHRIGQKHRCVIHRVIGSPEDQLIIDSITEKMKVLKEAL
jgi:SWI/SNF-related matrix-associated actin-dependent regulator 1 of chromatin subfamily A